MSTLFPHQPRRSCAPRLVELERFELGDEIRRASALPPAVPFTRTGPEIDEITRAADRAARAGAPDVYAEGFLACLSWLRGQLPTSNVLINWVDIDGRGELPL